jgi:uncharacterized membrane protein
MLTFCNSYPVRIWTAISFVDREICGGEGGDWRNRGWWGIDPGACVRVHSGNVGNVNRFWYFFAIADDGIRWEGEFPTFVKDPEAFDLCDGIGSTALQRYGFRELDVGDSDNATVNFAP